MTNRRPLSEDEWSDVRKAWESDERGGYAWIVRELGLPVSRVAVSKRANKEGWTKGGAPEPKKPKASKQADQQVAAKAEKPAEKPKEKPVTRETSRVTTATSGETNSETKNEEQAKRPMGRPTDYREEYAEQAYKLCLMGATDKQLADFFEVSEGTINNWKHRCPDFLKSIREGKHFADAEVAKALYSRAVGYDHEAVHFATVDGEVVQTPYIKHHAPDPWAASWWLKNRQPTLWKDKVEVKEEIDINVFPSREKLDAIYEKALAEAEDIEMRIVSGRAERLGINLDGLESDGDE